MTQNTQKSVLILGGGDHTKVIISVLLSCKTYSILGYLDLLDRGTILSVPYLGNDDQLSTIYQQYPDCIALIGVGHLPEKLSIRHRLGVLLENKHISSPVIVAETATIRPEVKMDNGTVVMDHCVIGPLSQIGKHSIINTGVIIEHDSSVGDYSHICPGVIICGGSHIGSNCFIGAGAIITQYVRIPDNCIIGAGALITNTIIDPGTYIGNPARLINKG